MPKKDRRSHSIASPEELISVGFVALPKRWVAERTFAWRGRDRRHSRGAEGAIHFLAPRERGWPPSPPLESMGDTGEMSGRHRIQFEGAIDHVMASASLSPTRR